MLSVAVSHGHDLSYNSDQKIYRCRIAFKLRLDWPVELQSIQKLLNLLCVCTRCLHLRFISTRTCCTNIASLRHGLRVSSGCIQVGVRRGALAASRSSILAVIDSVFIIVHTPW